MRGVHIANVVVWAPFLVLAPLRHSVTPKVWIGCNWMNVIVFVAALNIPGRADEIIGFVALAVVGASLMTWYVLHSKRVNVTYLNRVPAEGATTQP